MRRPAADIITKVLIIFDISYYIVESFGLLRANGRHRQGGIPKHFTQKIVSIILNMIFISTFALLFYGAIFSQEGWVSG